MVKGNQTRAASVAEESAKGIQKSSTRGAGERTTPQRCEPLGGMVDANVKLVMSVFAHTQAAFDVYIAGLKDRLAVWAKMFKGTFEAYLYTDRLTIAFLGRAHPDGCDFAPERLVREIGVQLFRRFTGQEPRVKDEACSGYRLSAHRLTMAACVASNVFQQPSGSKTMVVVADSEEIPGEGFVALLQNPHIWQSDWILFAPPSGEAYPTISIGLILWC